MSDTIRCPDHPNGQLVEDYRAGDMICRECGLVVGDRVIDVTSEWRTFANDSDSKDRSRVGDAQSNLLSGSDTSTRIGIQTKPGQYGTNDFAAGVQKRGSQNQSTNSADKYLMNGFREIKVQADRAALLESVVARAKLRFKEVYESKCLRNRSVPAIAAACIFIACREEQVPRSFKEICEISRVPKNDIGKYFKIIIKSLPSLAANRRPDAGTSENFMARFCSELELERPTRMCAEYISKRAKELDLAPGRNPLTIAAASLYMACLASEAREQRTLQEVCKTCGIAEGTAKNCYKILVKDSEKLFLESFKMHKTHAELKIHG